MNDDARWDEISQKLDELLAFVRAMVSEEGKSDNPQHDDDRIDHKGNSGETALISTYSIIHTNQSDD